LFFTIILALFATGDARRKHGKKNDWDALDSLLKNIDKNNDRIVTATINEGPEISDESNTENAKETKESKKANPCENHQCGWGKECTVVQGTKTKCDCIRKCPTNTASDSFDKACSNTNETFDSMCELYKERCLCRRDDASCRDLEKINICILNIWGHAKIWNHALKIIWTNSLFGWPIGYSKSCAI